MTTLAAQPKSNNVPSRDHSQNQPQPKTPRKSASIAPQAEPLTERDYQNHAASAIPRKVVDTAGVYRLSHAEAASAFGRQRSTENFDGVAYDNFWPGESRPRGRMLRRDNPPIENGKAKNKYVAAYGDKNMFYFARWVRSAVLADVNIPAIITEGQKKALSIQHCCDSRGRDFLIIGLSGVWNWKGRKGKVENENGVRVDETGVINDFERVAWKEREVIIIYDPDAATNQSVAAARRGLSAELKKRGAIVRVVNIPNNEDGINGADEFIAQRGGDAFFALLNQSAEKKEDEEAGKKQHAADFIDLIQENAELFHDAAGKNYAAIKIAGRRETYRIKSRSFKAWVAYLHHSKTRKGLSSERLAEVVLTFSAIARYEGEEREAHLRLAEHENAIYLDLCDSDWRQAEITASGWQVIASTSSPVYFRREDGMLPLPMPIHGGSLDTLRGLLNLGASNGDDLLDGDAESDAAQKADQQKAEDNWALFLAWLIGAMKPSNLKPISYPILGVHGEQGSGKSTLSRIARSVIDPHRADLRAAPKDTRDLAIAANRTWIPAFDNLTKMPEELSNALCRLSTGGAFTTRSLYSDDGETIFEARRPALLNGINEVISKADLQERALFLSLARIHTRRTEEDVITAFQAAHAEILGALLTAVSSGLAKLASGFQVHDLPRLADFCRWAEACAEGAGLTTGNIKNAIHGNQIAANQVLIEGSPIALALLKVVACAPEKTFFGTVQKLLEAANEKASGTTGIFGNRTFGWPANAYALSRKLRELAPVLRRAGVEIQSGGRTEKGRMVRLTTPVNATDETEATASNAPPQHHGKFASAASAASAASDYKKTKDLSPDASLTRLTRLTRWLFLRQVRVRT